MAAKKSRQQRRRDQRTQRRSSRLRGGVWILVVGLVAALALHAFVLERVGYDDTWSSWFTQDDAFISYRYARNALEGHGLVFNAGERVEGYTNFLWVLWLILAGSLGVEFDVAAKLLGLLSAAGMILLAGVLARQVWNRLGLKYADAAGVFAALLVAVNGSLAYWALSGLETVWFGLCVTLSIWWWIRNSRLVILGLTLAALTRPEGGLVWIVLIIAEWLLGGGLRRALVLLVSVGVLLIPYGVFKLLYYGSLFPNPFYAKTGFAWEYLASGLEYIWLYIQHYGLWGVAPLLIVLAIRPLSGRWRILPVIWVIYALYIISVGGDVLRPHRFFAPLTTVMAVSVIAGAGWIALLLRSRVFRVVIPALMVVALAAWSYIVPHGLIISTRRLELGLLNKMGFLARSLSAVDPTPFTLAASTIGRISYDLPGRRVIDMLGLTDSTIARHPEAIPGNTSTWKERNYNISYLLSQDPDYILFSTGFKPSAPAERALMLHQKYRRNYRTVLFSWYRQGRLGRNLAVHKRRGDYVGPDSVWPSIDLAHDINLAFNLQLSDRIDSSLSVLYRLKREGPGDFSLPDDFISTMLLRQGDYNAALAYADSALAIDSLSVVALQTRYAIAQQRGDTAAALAASRQFLRACPWLVMQ